MRAEYANSSWVLRVVMWGVGERDIPGEEHEGGELTVAPKSDFKMKAGCFEFLDQKL